MGSFMKDERQLVGLNQGKFDQIRHTNEFGQDCWSARQLSQILGYFEYRNFLPVLEKAKVACQNSKQVVSDHFVDINEMVPIGSGAERGVKDVYLSRYACYLIVQNADPSKPIVAIGQTYFAVQTRKQELIEGRQYNKLKTEEEKRLFLRGELKTHNIHLASAAKDAGVIKPLEYAIFQDHGYRGLYGGLGQTGIHQRKGLKKSQKILDHMGSTELAANLFRATQTEDKLRRDKIKGKDLANKTHYAIGQKVRQTIKEIGGIMPEDLPTPESIKKIENKRKKQVLKGKSQA
ncbi:MAG: DNA damage-inducible protein D [Candidatus Omnitrophica bacterium]|nr:DNA damage-inducible protein D [Candidatus Omnitrophota bacterium]